MSGLSNRFLLFSDNICTGFFPLSSDSGVILFLSPDGKQVRIIHGDLIRTHLTRYTPTSYRKYVKTLLTFRNSLVDSPYLCELFHGKNEYIGTQELRWIKCKRIDNTNFEDFQFVNDVNTAHTKICKRGRRVIYSGPAIYVSSEAEMETTHSEDKTVSTSTERHYTTDLKIAKPLSWISPEFHLLIASGITGIESSGTINTKIPVCIERIKDTSHIVSYTMKAFDELQLLAYWLQDSRKLDRPGNDHEIRSDAEIILRDVGNVSYPTYSGGMVVAEYVKDCRNADFDALYIFTGLKIETDKAEDVAVEAWIRSKRRRAIAYEEKEMEMNHFQLDSFDDVFSIENNLNVNFTYDNIDGIEQTDTMHIHLLKQYEMMDAAHNEREAVNINLGDQYTRFVKHAHVIHNLKRFEDQVRNGRKRISGKDNKYQMQYIPSSDKARLNFITNPADFIQANRLTSNSLNTKSFSMTIKGGKLYKLPDGRYYGSYDDHTLLSLNGSSNISTEDYNNVSNDVITAVLPSGDEKIYSLQSCLDASISDDRTVMKRLLTQKPQSLNAYIRTYERPSFETALKCRQLLNFRTKCEMNHEDWNWRQQNLEDAMKVSVSAALDCTRTLVKCQLINSELSVESAYEKTASVAKSLTSSAIATATYTNDTLNQNQSPNVMNEDSLLSPPFLADQLDMLRYEGQNEIKRSQNFLNKVKLGVK